MNAFSHTRPTPRPRWRESPYGTGPEAPVAARAPITALHGHTRDAGNSTAEMERAAGLASNSRRASAHLAAVGDKRFLFSASGRSFIMYQRYHRGWIAMGDPIGDPTEVAGLVSDFVELAYRERGWPVFYQVHPEQLDAYRCAGLRELRIGQEARVHLTTFNMEGRRRARLRQTLRRTERGGGSFEVLEPVDVPELLPELRRISDGWLEERKTREKGFSLGRFSESYVSRFPVALVRQEGRPVAFANLFAGNPGSEVATDLTRYTADAPYGVMEYMSVKLFEWARDTGFAYFSLGMAPLSGLRDAPRCAWERLGAAVFEKGERFYNFRGVHTYKSKFDPRWETRYLVAPRGLRLPLSVAKTSALVAGGLRGVFAV